MRIRGVEANVATGGISCGSGSRVVVATAATPVVVRVALQAAVEGGTARADQEHLHDQRHDAATQQEDAAAGRGQGRARSRPPGSQGLAVSCTRFPVGPEEHRRPPAASDLGQGSFRQNHRRRARRSPGQSSAGTIAPRDVRPGPPGSSRPCARPYHAVATRRGAIWTDEPESSPGGSHTEVIKALPEHFEKAADGAGSDPALAIFKPVPMPQAQSTSSNTLAGPGGGFRGVTQVGQSVRAPGAPTGAPGTGNALDRYGPACRRPRSTDPLTLGGALKMGVTKTAGSAWPRSAAVGSRNPELLGTAMRAFEAAWAKSAIADLSPAPMTKFTGQVAPPPPSPRFPQGRSSCPRPKAW